MLIWRRLLVLAPLQGRVRRRCWNACLCVTVSSPVPYYSTTRWWGPTILRRQVRHCNPQQAACILNRKVAYLINDCMDDGTCFVGVPIGVQLMIFPDSRLIADSVPFLQACGPSLPPSRCLCLPALVHQTDLLFGFLTVREHLTYHAIARLGHTYQGEAVERRVSDVMSELGLDKCADTIIGGTDAVFLRRGISGGERKRVSIATELLRRPLVGGLPFVGTMLCMQAWDRW